MINDPIEYIRNSLDQSELLALVAEESSELSHAALKLRRVYEGTNPTPVRRQDAYMAVLEEIADVSLALEVLGFNRPIPLLEIQKKMNEKLQRWVERLQEKEGSEDDPEVQQQQGRGGRDHL